MIAYITLGTNDLPRAAAFYDALLGELGAKRILDMDTFIAWGTTPDAPMVCVTKPYDGKAATCGNGTMIALGVDSKQNVDRLHQKALELGGSDEGAPGPRGSAYYIGYFRDLDGNKLNFFYTGN